MKNLFYFTTVIFLLLTGIQARGQNVIRPSHFTNIFILHQADSIKLELSKQGFIVVKEASMNMESNKELPVMVPLTEGSCYQFIFIAELNSTLSEMSMFNWDEKELMHEKKRWGDVDDNVIRYSFTPAQTGFYLVKAMQVNEKKQHPRGYIMLLKRIKG